MRFLLASSGLAALSVMLATSAGAVTTVSTATTTPLKTSVSGDIEITSAGSIKPTSGAAVTIDSYNYVKNGGTIAITGANGATGILANPNVGGYIINNGTITIDENYTPTDTDKDGDIDGPFAQGSDRYGIRILSGGIYDGNILNTGTITVEGNGSGGIGVDSALTGNLASSGKITVLGDNSVGIRTSSVGGNVTIDSGSTTTVQGANSVGVLLGGDIGGALVIQGTVTATGYRYVTPPADTSKLDSDDLLQGGSAVVVSGSVAHGILLDAKPADNDPNSTDEDHDGIPDANETTASVNSYGAAPALAIGSTTQDIQIGAVASSSLGHGIVIKGNVSGNGVYSGISGTGIMIGGTGHAVQVAGGMTIVGTVTASATAANATAVHVGAGATVPQIVVGGTISSTGAGADGTAATGILIDSGATVNAIYNSGSISATQSADNGSAAAIVDKSGTLALVQNSGSIAVTGPAGSTGTAIDLRATAAGAIVRQVAAASGAPAPVISGDILFGSGNDTLDIQAGSVLGNVDFGGGSDVLSLSGTSLFRGTLANSSGVAVTVGTGSTLDVNNLGAVNLASLTTAANSAVGVTIANGANTLYDVSGAATFGEGTKVLVTLGKVGDAAGTYTIVDASSLVGADNLTSSIVTLPFLFNSKLISDATTGQVALDIELKDSGELGLNRSETAILDAALAAADTDQPFSTLFLSVADAPTLKTTLQQMLPNDVGGVFESATKGTRLASEILSDPRPISGLWLQQVAGGSSKSIGDTSSYKIDTWGAIGGYDVAVGPIGNVGVSLGYYFGNDKHLGNQLMSNHYEGGVYWRGGAGPLRAWARATAGLINFDSTRNFSAGSTGGTITRTADGSWNGHLYSGSGGVSYEAHAGALSIRPNASIEYYKLSEDGYTETGGGTGLDLTVRSRNSNEAAATAMLTLGYDLMRPADQDSNWIRFELEGGRREILSGSLGDTIASFGSGDPFTLTAEDRTSGWRGAIRAMGGGGSLSFTVEGNAEQQQGHMSIGARAALRLGI